VAREQDEAVTDHEWQLCRPTVHLQDADPDMVELFNTAAQRVWDRLPPADRRAFHSYTCLNNHNAYNSEVVHRINQAIQDQALADTRRHQENARSVLNFAERVGMEVYTPRAGEEVKIMVTRVRDSLLLGDDPPPWVARRRTIVACTKCGEDCWLDPLSYGEATPIPVCMRCLDPEIDKLIEQEIAKTRRSKP
jgi:hypothetical protein